MNDSDTNDSDMMARHPDHEVSSTGHAPALVDHATAAFIHAVGGGTHA